VTNCPNIHMRLITLEFLFRHLAICSRVAPALSFETAARHLF
jgi:hypothetical protein